MAQSRYKPQYLHRRETPYERAKRTGYTTEHRSGEAPPRKPEFGDAIREWNAEAPASAQTEGQRDRLAQILAAHRGENSSA